MYRPGQRWWFAEFCMAVPYSPTQCLLRRVGASGPVPAAAFLINDLYVLAVMCVERALLSLFST